MSITKYAVRPELSKRDDRQITYTKAVTQLYADSFPIRMKTLVGRTFTVKHADDCGLIMGEVKK